jgi:aryl-alcohol dehydrogenase-like predicted oxidoreductase
VLRTLTEKFGLKRDEVFISSKQGFVGYNSIDHIKETLQVEEWLSSTNLKSEDFWEDCMYSIHPTFLDISLKNSLQKMNLETIDCALLQTPFEI